MVRWLWKKEPETIKNMVNYCINFTTSAVLSTDCQEIKLGESTIIILKIMKIQVLTYR
jgi:hypothetical protein